MLHSKDIPVQAETPWNVQEPVRWQRCKCLRDYELLITNTYILIGPTISHITFSRTIARMLDFSGCVTGLFDRATAVNQSLTTPV